MSTLARAMRAILVLARGACAWGAACALLVRALGLVLSDRLHWSQYVAWTPAWASLGAAILLLALWWLLRRVTPKPRPSRWKFPCAPVLTALTLAGVLHMLVIDWRVPAGFITPARDPASVRVLVWNPSWEQMSAFHERLLEHNPDVILVSNPHHRADWVALRERMGEHTYALRQGLLVVVSRYPIRRFGWTPLTIREEPDRPAWWKAPRTSTAGGEAMFIELDIPAWQERGGSAPTIWFLDLPSDMWIHRERMLREAAASIAAFRGPVLRRDDAGRDVPEKALRLGALLPDGGIAASPAGDALGFPTPDLVVGDFNTPRASRSLRHLVGDMTHAHDQAGLGPSTTFPRPLGVTHIDHAFVGPRLRAIRYRVVDPGASRHFAQVVDVAPATPAPTRAPGAP